jgi:dihydrofolate reductase
MRNNEAMFRLIAAVDRKLGLAKQGFQPWYIPEDEQYFTDKTKTHGGNVLVGNTTYKTFGGKPLEGRQNYVLTRDKSPIEGSIVVNDLKHFYEEFEHIDVWVIGGANVFAQVMEDGKADELYLTQIEADFGCNQFFPQLEQNYQISEQSELHEQNGFIYRYVIYKKVS